jgi:beta-galactosidase
MRLTLLFAMTLAAHAAVSSSFDHGWRFFKGDAPGAEAPAFEDSGWRTVDVPHDWSIDGPFDAKNPTGGGGGFLPAGIGWYRKTFTVPAAERGKLVFIDFDGVMANSDVWINGFHLGKRPYGYVSFRYELTPHVNFGKPNVIAVRADNSGQPASRWFAGAGIYRHVRLAVADPVHMEHWATFVTTKGKEVRVTTTVVNQSDRPRSLALAVRILGPDGAAVAHGRSAMQTLAPGKSADFEQLVTVASPQLWDLDHPVLCRAEVRTGADIETIPFGIRDYRFDAATGFWLNGSNFKIKGVCLHEDGGAMGTAIPLGVWERRLTRLKQIGVNAVRTAHHPHSPDFLDLCDRMGLLVMDEMFDAWTVAKNPHDYHLYFREWSHRDTADSVRRDRNHPSIILHSAGNEIHDTPKADLAKEILGGLVTVFHANDPTRPVTQALFRPNVSHDYDNGLADLLDVVGQNYRENEILAAHDAKPSRKIVGTENQHDRRVWLALRDNAPYAGQFLWSGIDYLGESRSWPVVDAGSGLLDRTGAMKPIAYERQSWWSGRPMVYITRRTALPRLGPTDPGYEAGPVTPVHFPQTLFPDWTPANTAPHEENVEVYSNCEEVELLLNGKSLGTKPLPADASPRVWRVAYEPGTLHAVARNKGAEAATSELRTAGKAAKVMLSVDRSRVRRTWDDVAFVTATVVDANGVPVPNADPLISFQASEGGVIAAVDSPDHSSHEPFQASERKAFQGWCIAIVKAKRVGPITITASAPGLAGSSVTVQGE